MVSRVIDSVPPRPPVASASADGGNTSQRPGGQISPSRPGSVSSIQPSASLPSSREVNVGSGELDRPAGDPGPEVLDGPSGGPARFSFPADLDSPAGDHEREDLDGPSGGPPRFSFSADLDAPAGGSARFFSADLGSPTAGVSPESQPPQASNQHPPQGLGEQAATEAGDTSTFGDEARAGMPAPAADTDALEADVAPTAPVPGSEPTTSSGPAEESSSKFQIPAHQPDRDPANPMADDTAPVNPGEETADANTAPTEAAETGHLGHNNEGSTDDEKPH